MAKRQKIMEGGTSTWELTPEEKKEQDFLMDVGALEELLERAAKGGGPRYSALMIRLGKRFEKEGEDYWNKVAAKVKARKAEKAERAVARESYKPAPTGPAAEAAPRIPQRTEPYSGAQFGGYLPIPHPQWGGLGGYAPPGATPEMLAPYQERISATTEMARNRLADIIRRWETFKTAHFWRGSEVPDPWRGVGPVPWGGALYPWRRPAAPAPWDAAAREGAMLQTPVAQNPIERLRQRQLQAQQGLQQQALAGQQARQAAGSQLANMRWNPQEMQQFGQQMPGTRTFPGQIFPEAPQLNLFPGGSYQGSVTSPWEGW